jgi:ElaB/YqjD/DUF883 family membrane-anchored ribosome-binding protein
MNTMNTMNKHTAVIEQDLEQLAKDTNTLIAATADVLGEQVSEARQRLAGVLERGKEFYGLVRGKAVERSRAADLAVHENLYQVILLGVGAGALIGYLFSSRCKCERTCKHD